MDVSSGTRTSKLSLAQRLKRGVILDVETLEHARIDEEEGACAVMVHERVPADIRIGSRVERMSNLELILEIKAAVCIPVMAKCRIGHFVEAQILQCIGVDAVDESEDLTRADESHSIWKHNFDVPFLCGASHFGEALRRIGEGAAMIRTTGGDRSDDISGTIRQIRNFTNQIRLLRNLPEAELMAYTKETGGPLELVKDIKEQGCLPVPMFASGGVSTPADAAMVMQLGLHGVFVGSEIFSTSKPVRQVGAIVRATRYWDNTDFVAEVSRNLGSPMKTFGANTEKRWRAIH